MAATTWYVNGSGGASNGFLAAGNDTTGNGTLATPYATINKALTVSATGDTIYCDTATYSESSGSNYLNVTKGVTIATYPTAVTNSGKATLQATETNRVVNINAANVNFTDFIFDANTAAKSCALLQANATGTFTRVDIKGMGSGSTLAGWRANGNGTSVTLDKCTNLLANGNASNTNLYFNNFTGGTVVFKGCTANGVNQFCSSSAASTLIQSATSADGTRNTVTNCTVGFRLPAAATTTIDIEDVDFSGVTGNPIWDNASNAASCNALSVKYCTFTNQTGSIPCISLYGSYSSPEIAYNYLNSPCTLFTQQWIGVTSPLVHDNTIIQSSALHEPINIQQAAGSPQVYNNTITTDFTGHAIEVGSDGTNAAVTFTTGFPGSPVAIPLGDTSAHTYVAQKFTFNASTVVLNSQIMCSLRPVMKKTGTPTGSVTCYLYSDNAGVPGTLVDTSEYSMLGANQSATQQWVEYWFPNRDTLSYSTSYWMVLKYNGTPDASNYVTLEGNGTAAPVQTSTDGVTWSAGTNQAWFQVRTGAYEIVDPVIHDNKVTVTNSAAPHCCFIGAAVGGKIYRNQIYGGGIPLIMKLVDGSNNSHPALIYDNLVWDNVGSQQAIRDKGSRSVQIYHNTIVETSTAEVAVTLDNDYEATSPYTPQYNGQPSQNAVVKNNVFYCTSPSGSSPIYQLGALSMNALPNCVNPTIDYNVAYVGANTSIATDNRSGSAVNYNTGTAAQQFAQWQGLGFDVHGKNADPLLANEVNPSKPTDFIPAATSPAIGMGTNLTSTVSSGYNAKAFIAAGPTVGALNANYRSISPTRTIVR
jgi:hypothetical protein